MKVLCMLSRLARLVILIAMSNSAQLAVSFSMITELASECDQGLHDSCCWKSIVEVGTYSNEVFSNQGSIEGEQ